MPYELSTELNQEPQVDDIIHTTGIPIRTIKQQREYDIDK